ncbi:hypothetical protein SAMN04489729_7055 [Amycolatopsis lurida]|uniref:Uncharacterized protein n=1 Tax=Amycolatopsis lurida NRRL 2430 TaxID=1460371 RepID=A0A2P2FG27_AMYLU|nr:hypothetical protein [Amycolatopsis lurida]KFU75671.1 hypothetical protein BB31_40365 [Amycolatopsis lurida NRRL 2430]SEE31390.1 hypothetical protein SAMN04489729_7055 [Amycolatopsis lurida]
MNSSLHPQAESIVLEGRGRHLLIRRHDEAEPGGAIGWPTPVPGHAFVLASTGARRDPSLTTLLPSLLHRHIASLGDVRSVRIGIPGLGADRLVSQALADALDVEIFAPDDDFVTHPGGALFAGRSGWLLFRPGSACAVGGYRYPVPRWEASMPATPLTVEGAVIDAIPAGVLIREANGRSALPGDPAYAVPADAGVMRIVVGEGGMVPAPAVVAVAAARLPRIPVQLVVLPSPARTHSWLRDFARAFARDIVVVTGLAAGSGMDSFPPFASSFRQRVDGSQEVIDGVPPPRGWQRRHLTGYRFGNVLADIVPSGLALRTGAADPDACLPPFDPDRWTMHLGTPGEPIGPELLTAAEALLAELEPGVRDASSLRLAGVLDDRARELLSEPSAPAVGAAPPTVPRAEPATQVPGRERLRPPISEELRPTSVSTRGPAVPTSLLMSGPPVPTVSGAPGNSERIPASTSVSSAGTIASALQNDQVAQEVGAPAADDRPSARPAEPAAETGADAAGPGLTRTSSVEPAPESPGLGEQLESEAGAKPAAEHLTSSGKELDVADRPSTSTEKARFTAAAGEAYSEALATVNAALATWPSMRQADAGAKADFVAVCLYLGRGAGSFAELDAAVRTGYSGVLDAQVPCLVSGLRRMPTHRRAVLRQSISGRIESAVEPGAVLTESGFLVGSTDLDVTVPDADLDVLIWPVSARRTSELRIGQAVNEVVFFAGARFKALAIRSAEAAEEPADDGPVAPRTAALFRELAPGEHVASTGELDEQDLAALTKLDQALERRRRCTLRVVDQPEVQDRMTTSLREWREEAVARTAGNRTTTLAS